MSPAPMPIGDSLAELGIMDPKSPDGDPKGRGNDSQRPGQSQGTTEFGLHHFFDSDPGLNNRRLKLVSFFNNLLPYLLHRLPIRINGIASESGI
jgi:hypothetical protein